MVLKTCKNSMSLGSYLLFFSKKNSDIPSNKTKIRFTKKIKLIYTIYILLRNILLYGIRDLNSFFQQNPILVWLPRYVYASARARVYYIEAKGSLIMISNKGEKGLVFSKNQFFGLVDFRAFEGFLFVRYALV